ncbi:MAG: tRNA uracil 4-sulfurtransferase ThiI [Myxococcota bacterium]
MHVVVHYAEIALKGRNRPRFEQHLLRQLRRVLRPLGPVEVRRLFGRVLVELPDGADFDEVSHRISQVFAVAYFSRASVLEPTLEAIHQAVDELVDGASFETFGVNVRRADKKHPWTSTELNRELGARIVARTGKKVDLSDPDLWVELHLLSEEAILLWRKIPGPGGLPVGSAGRAVSLISGGIDSPIASYRMLKRGLELVYVHFHSAPYTGTASQHKVRDLVARLAVYQGPVRLYQVPFGEIQQTLVREAPAEPRIVLYRRFMLRVAEAIAESERALALVTGDSLGQVSSQTLANLDTISRVTTLPVLRPLVGMDKLEIIALAEQVGTYAISIEPDEDCCSYLMPRRPATWTRPGSMETIERALDTKGMVAELLRGACRERIEPVS